jgi:hypothetical protein
MSNSVIGSLRVALGLDAAQFETGARRAKSAADQLSNRMRILGAAVTAVAAGIAYAVRGQINAIDDLAKSADRIGIPVEALSQLQHAANLSGVQMSTLQGAMQRLSRGMVESAGDFAALGIAVRDANGQMRPTVDVLDDVADVLASMPEGAERTALAVRLLGRSGAELIPMLRGGSAGLQAMRAEADALGLTISNQTARRVEAFNDNLTRLRSQFTGLIRILTAQMAPALEAISNTIVVASQALSGNLQAAISGFGVVVVTLAATQIPAAVAALAAMTYGITAAGAAAGIAAGAMRFLGAAVALAGGPFGILAAIIAGAVSYMILFRDTTATVAPIMQEANSAVEAINNALAVSSERLPATARATLQLTNENIRLAQSAYAAAEAQVALAQAGLQYAQTELNLQSAFSPTSENAQALRDMQRASDGLTRAQSDLIIAQSSLNSRINEGQLALNEVAEAAGETNRELTLTVDVVGELSEEMGQAGGNAGDLAAGLDNVADALQNVNDATKQVESAFESAFVNFVTGAQSAREALASLARDLARLLAQRAFQQLFGGFFDGGGFLAGLFGGLPSADGGGFTGSGPRTGGLDGKGGFLAMLHPRETIVDHTRGQGGGEVQVVVRVDNDGMLRSFVEQTSGQVVARSAPRIVAQSVSATYAASTERKLR